MKVTAIGTGNSWYTRNNTSFILDDNMLFDVSAGNYRDIIKEIDIFDLNAIFISHLHIDHFGDLHIITTRFIREAKKRNRLTKLRIYGLKGIANYLIEFNRITFASDDETDIDILESVVEFIEVEDGSEFEESGYKVKVFKMLHGKMECYGYSFTDETGKTVSFSADSSNCESLEKMLSQSDYAFVDMAGVTENPYHLHYDGFVQLSKQYSNCKMFPVHTSDKSQEFAMQNGLNFLVDGQIVEL